MKKILLFICLLTGIVSTNAQMVTESALTVEQYVQDVLLGANVTVSNITYNGGSASTVSTAVGGFECVDCNLGIESGFAMSSGDVAGLVGPNNSTSYTGSGSGLFSGSDPDLLDLVQDNGGSSIHDWAIIEFDFVPLGDTLRFNYVWGSEEYDTFVGSSYNDVFGFFISGPGISGPFSNSAMNIALVPGTTDTGVSINNINNGNGNAGPCAYCEFYNQADSDADAFTNADEDIHTSPYYMQFDGYTDVLTAIAIVQCGQTYHIKLAISDANDSSLDSGVFLQRDSFSSNLVVQATLNLAVSGPDEHTLFENCGDGYIVFARPESGNPDQELVAYLEYSGTAQNGIDFTQLPDSVVFPPGVMSISLYLDAFADGVAEGVETAHLEISNIADCGESLVSAGFDFFVSDIAEPLVVEGYDIQICTGETVTIEPIITGGYAVYHFDWSTGEDTETIDVSPGASTTYFLTVSDTCGMPSDDAQYFVEVLVTPELLVDIVDSDGILPLTCSTWGNIYGIAEGGISPYTFTWTDEDGFNLWGWENTLGISSWNAGMIYVEVEDECGFTANDSIEITLDVPEMFVDMPETINAPCGLPYTVTAVATGGETMGWGYSYSWYLNGVSDWSQWTETFAGVANEPALVTVQVFDQCGQSVWDSTSVTIESPPVVLTLVDSVFGTCATVFNLVPDVSSGSGNFYYTWSENGSLLSENETLNFSNNENTTVNLTVTDDCGQTASDEVAVTIDNPEIFVDLGDDINASCVDYTLLTPVATGGSGGNTFQWSANGSPQGTFPTYTVHSGATVTVDVVVTDFCGESATDQLLVIIPDNPLSIISSNDTTVCPGSTVHLSTLASGGEGGFTYAWHDGATGPEIDVTPPASFYYTVVASDICGHQISDEMVVNILPVHALFNVENMGENLYNFSAAPVPTCDGCYMAWDFGDGNTSLEPNPTHTFDGLASYEVSFTVINEIGCSDIQYYTIIPPASFFIPNSFTPNNDGINDVFKVIANAAMEYEIHIFNRWGDEVFSSTDPEEVWVGDTKGHGDFFVQNSVYNYSLRVKGYDTQTYKQKGTILVFR